MELAVAFLRQQSAASIRRLMRLSINSNLTCNRRFASSDAEKNRREDGSSAGASSGAQKDPNSAQSRSADASPSDPNSVDADYGALLRTGTGRSVKATEFQKRLLVFTGTYKSMAEVPENVRQREINSLHDRMRVLVLTMIVLGSVSFFAFFAMTKSIEYWDNVAAAGGGPHQSQELLGEARRERRKEILAAAKAVREQRAAARQT